MRAEYVREPGRAWRVLGLSPDADVEEIKMAYRQLTLQNHPDKVANLGPEFVKIAEEKFKIDPGSLRGDPPGEGILTTRGCAGPAARRKRPPGRDSREAVPVYLNKITKRALR